MNTPRIETGRLILRRFEERDIAALFELLSDEEVNRFLPWWPAKTPDDARKFCKARQKVYAQPEGYAWAICLKQDDRPIGYIGADTQGAHDFGYGLSRAHWHKGITTEAARAAVEQLRKDGVPFITATHDVNNPRSGAVMRAIGMKYCYSYEEQWQPKDFLVTFRMYQMNFDGNAERVYSGYWDTAKVRFVEEGV